MTPALLLLFAPAWFDPYDAPADVADPPPAVERRVRWLPRVTLRFTRRAASAWWAESLSDSLSTPLGTTFEVRLEWGGGALPDPPR